MPLGKVKENKSLEMNVIQQLLLCADDVTFKQLLKKSQPVSVFNYLIPVLCKAGIKGDQNYYAIQVLVLQQQ
jgi:hypothetical protein